MVFMVRSSELDAADTANGLSSTSRTNKHNSINSEEAVNKYNTKLNRAVQAIELWLG